MDPYSPTIDKLYSRVLKNLEGPNPDFHQVKLLTQAARRLVEFRDDYTKFRDSLFTDLTVD